MTMEDSLADGARFVPNRSAWNRKLTQKFLRGMVGDGCEPGQLALHACLASGVACIRIFAKKNRRTATRFCGPNAMINL